MDVVPVQLTIYSLSRLIRKISDLYPSSHFLWHHVPPVPHLVQEYWGFFNAWTLPFPHGKETVSHCDRPWHFLSAQWQHGVNIKHWSVQLPHIFHQISTCSLPRLFQPHCDVQDSFLFPLCWCCVHDWNCREVDSAGAFWLWLIASRFRSQLIYIAAPSPALLWHLWSLALNSSYAYRAKMIKIVAPWYFSPLVRHALQLSAMSATIPDVRHTCNQQSAWCDQRATHLVLEHFRYHFPNASSVQTCHPLADIQMNWIWLYALLCTYRLNWARRTSRGWWDEWGDTALQTRDSKFKPWRSEAEHATYRSRRSPTILSFTSGWGRNIFVVFSNRRDRETNNRTLAWKAAALATTLGPPPSRFTNSSTKECCTGESSYWNTGEVECFAAAQWWENVHTQPHTQLKKLLVLCAYINYTYSYITWCLTTLTYSV